MKQRKIRVFVAVSPNGWDATGWGAEDEDEKPEFIERQIRDGWAAGEVEAGRPVLYYWITAEVGQPEPLPAPSDDVEAEVEP